jgi:hypothetical protein
MYQKCVSCAQKLFLTRPLDDSDDVALYVDAAQNALKKRIEVVSSNLANWLNTHVFSLSGCHRSLRPWLGGTPGTCLIEKVVGVDRQGLLIPTSELAAKNSFITKGGYKHELHFTIGVLRQFDVSVNCPEEGGQPFCDLGRADEQYIVGGELLDSHGPMSFEIMKQITPHLGGKLAALFDSVRSPQDVDAAMNEHFIR